jgi:hypothetical protein
MRFGRALDITERHCKHSPLLSVVHMWRLGTRSDRGGVASSVSAGRFRVKATGTSAQSLSSERLP